MSLIQQPGSPGANPLVLLAQSLQVIHGDLAEIAKNTAKGPPHLAAVAALKDGGWGVFCLGCTAEKGYSTYVYPCKHDPEPEVGWPPAMLIEVPEAPA